MRKYCIAGWQDYYACDISDCYLKIHTDLLSGRDDPFIVWADNEGFSPYDVPDRDLLAEPAASYVIAAELKWRFNDSEA